MSGLNFLGEFDFSESKDGSSLGGGMNPALLIASSKLLKGDSSNGSVSPPPFL